MKFTLEIIAFNIESCQLAQVGGADRIELCDNPGDGGTTPSFGFIQAARNKTSLPLYPMIRPRGGDFFYSKDEFDIMKADIRTCKQLGCDGIVIGLLQKDGSVDELRTAQLVEIAYPMGVTFHRAFDRTNDPFKAMETIIDTGCERILTSGQTPDVTDGLALIGSLIQKAADRIIIMPGGGVRSGNIKNIASITGATEFHSSAKKIQKSKMDFIPASMSEHLSNPIVDEAEVMAMRTALAEN